MRHIFGIDSGVTRTGVCQVLDTGDSLDIMAAATFDSKGSDRDEAGDKFSSRPAFERVQDLAYEICKWIGEKAGEEVAFAIERPVYNKNAKAFELQWRLFHEIVSTLQSVYSGVVISEVHNGTAKHSLTGDGSAGKDKMLAEGIFEVHQFPDQEDREAVTDAYAIAISVDLGNPICNTSWETPGCKIGPVAEWPK